MARVCWRSIAMALLSFLLIGCADLSEERLEPSQVASTNGSSALFPESGNGGYQVIAYHWQIEISEDLTSLTGTATTEAVAIQDLRRFSLDSRNLDISSVDVQGQDSDFVVEENELIITVGDLIPVDSTFRVTVDYTATPEPYRPPGAALLMGWNVTPGEQLLTGGLPGSDATWVPLNEDLFDPAQFVLELTVSDGFTATASGVLQDSESADGSTTYVWGTERPVDEVSLSVARYQTFEEGDFQVSVQDGESAEHFLDLMPPMISFLEGVFGPLPYRPLGLSTLKDKTFAISTPGRIFAPPDLSPVILLHELSHQWIGNSVTTSAFEDDWMIEGLADYATILWQEHMGGQDVGRKFADGTLARLGGETRPLDSIETVEDIFDPDIYSRGALVFHALRLEIGDESFFATLRALQDRFAGRAVTTDDLRTLAEEMSGSALKGFFQSWVSQPEIPALPSS